MSKSYVTRTIDGVMYTEPRGSDEPGGPLTPVGHLFVLLCLLMGIVGIVLIVMAANEPNPGEPGYVQPGSSQSIPQ